MTNLNEFVKQHKKALNKKDIKEAQRLLTKLKKELKKQQSWDYLRSNKPESYKQLYRKLRDTSESLSPSGKSIMRQLIRIFTWCEKHKISLPYLDVSANLHKYREDTSYLIRIITKDANDAEIKRELGDAISRIKADKNRDVTRSWTRKKRSG